MKVKILIIRKDTYIEQNDYDGYDYNENEQYEDEPQGNSPEPNIERLKWYLKYDGIQLLTIIQIVLCTIILLFFIAAKAFGGNFYQSINFWYQQKVNDSLIAGTDINVGSDLMKKIGFDQSDKNLPENSLENICLSTALSAPLENGTLTSHFGKREDPFSKDEKFHYGMDIAAQQDEPIHAVLPGVVEKCDENKSYGKYIILDHGNNIKTIYAHCHKLKAVKDQAIARGEEIAFVGSTGHSTGEHLHFEIRINDNKYNPEQFLKGLYI